MSFSLMSFQMMRVISSPSISTTGFLTLIFAIADGPLCARKSEGKPGRMPWAGALWRGRGVPARTKLELARQVNVRGDRHRTPRRRRPLRRAMLEPLLVGWPVLRDTVMHALAARGQLVFCQLGDVRFFVDPSD